MHFNLNLRRDIDTRKADSQEKIRVTYPKFKNGEATVRHVRVKPKFDYVKDIYATFLTSTEQELKNAIKKLKEMSPELMDSMLEKQPKTQAIAKHKERKSIVTQDVPPTTPVSEVQRAPANGKKKSGNSEKAKPHCTHCHRPMKGH